MANGLVRTLMELFKKNKIIFYNARSYIQIVGKKNVFFCSSWTSLVSSFFCRSRNTKQLAVKETKLQGEYKGFPLEY